MDCPSDCPSLRLLFEHAYNDGPAPDKDVSIWMHSTHFFLYFFLSFLPSLSIHHPSSSIYAQLWTCIIYIYIYTILYIYVICIAFIYLDISIFQSYFNVAIYTIPRIWPSTQSAVSGVRPARERARHRIRDLGTFSLVFFRGWCHCPMTWEYKGHHLIYSSHLVDH